MRSLASVILTILWVIGIVVAQGFWSTFFAVIIPLWGWYLAVEHFLTTYGAL